MGVAETTPKGQILNTVITQKRLKYINIAIKLRFVIYTISNIPANFLTLTQPTQKPNELDKFN
jgi:hypothetical protein